MVALWRRCSTKKWREFLIGLVITCLISEQVYWVIPSGMTTETLHPKTKLSSSARGNPQAPSSFSPKRRPSIFNESHLGIPVLTMALLMLYHFAWVIVGNDTLRFDHARMGFFVFFTGIVPYLLFVYQSSFREESDDQWEGLFDEAQRDYMGIPKVLGYVKILFNLALWWIFSALLVMSLWVYWYDWDPLTSLSVEHVLIWIEQAVFIVLNGRYFYQAFLKSPDQIQPVMETRVKTPLIPIPKPNAHPLTNTAALEFAL